MKKIKVLRLSEMTLAMTFPCRSTSASNLSDDSDDESMVRYVKVTEGISQIFRFHFKIDHPVLFSFICGMLWRSV